MPKLHQFQRVKFSKYSPKKAACDAADGGSCFHFPSVRGIYTESLPPYRGSLCAIYNPADDIIPYDVTERFKGGFSETGHLDGWVDRCMDGWFKEAETAPRMFSRSLYE